MLISDKRVIGNRLLAFRKKAGLTQAETAERAGISDRAYADIERGTVNMQLETLINICKVLSITPDELLTGDKGKAADPETILLDLEVCTEKQRRTAFELLSVYIRSLR